MQAEQRAFRIVGPEQPSLALRHHLKEGGGIPQFPIIIVTAGGGSLVWYPNGTVRTIQEDVNEHNSSQVA